MKWHKAFSRISSITALKKVVEFAPEKKEVETLWVSYLEEQAGE